MIAIIDYDMGNLYSIRSMLEYLGETVIVSRDPLQLAKADGLILPGVGSFRMAMQRLNEYQLIAPINNHVKRGAPLLGICLGMQLLGVSSTEDGLTEGLGFIAGHVEQFVRDVDRPYKKIPHVGFNDIVVEPGSRLLSGLPEAPDFYFTHSYCMQCTDEAQVSSRADNDELFVSSVEHGNVFGTQFHPELSQKNGLLLMKNFVALA